MRNLGDQLRPSRAVVACGSQIFLLRSRPKCDCMTAFYSLVLALALSSRGCEAIVATLPWWRMERGVNARQRIAVQAAIVPDPASAGDGPNQPIAAERYELIHDLEQIRKFERMFYAPSVDSTFIIYLAARKKYDPLMRKSQGLSCFCRKKIHYASPDSDSRARLEYDVQSYMVPMGTYRINLRSEQGDEDEAIRTESMAIYASLNPRDSAKAAAELFGSMSTQLTGQASGSGDLQTFARKAARYMNLLCKYGTRNFIGIDLDTKDQETYSQVITDLKARITIHAVIETRGGYHIILAKSELDKASKADKRFIYNVLKERDAIDIISNDLFSPIPGTYQGGHRVRFVDF